MSADKRSSSSSSPTAAPPHGSPIVPAPEVASARRDARKRKLPQCIAHRGYKAKFPENSLLAFQEAIKVGAAAIETDVHLTQDEVVVLSHDASLKRCFGHNTKIIESTWDAIKDLRTTAPPHVPMPRLVDLLDLLTQPEYEHAWVLLDIKMDNDCDDVMRLIGQAVASVKPLAHKPWASRIVLGVWAAKLLPPALKYVPDFPVVHIGFETAYARHFFSVPNVGFNMILPSLLAPGGRAFVHDCQEVYHRQLLAWTVNKRDRMEWCIRHHLDGLITDDPKVYLEVCEQYDETSTTPNYPLSRFTWVSGLRYYVMVTVLLWFFGKRFRPIASPELLKKET